MYCVGGGGRRLIVVMRRSHPSRSSRKRKKTTGWSSTASKALRTVRSSRFVLGMSRTDSFTSALQFYTPEVSHVGSATEQLALIFAL